MAVDLIVMEYGRSEIQEGHFDFTFHSRLVS